MDPRADELDVDWEAIAADYEQLRSEAGYWRTRAQQAGADLAEAPAELRAAHGRPHMR